MPTLTEMLLAPGNRPKVIADCTQLINEAVDHMLDDFVKRLEPFWADAQAKNEPVGPLMNARAPQVADALLAISDERAQRSTNPTLKKAYEKLRPTGKKHVEQAVPRAWYA